MSVGVGLKPMHVRTILASRPEVGFFEIHAENYMGAGGTPHRHLQAIREHYPLSIHGVGLSLGGARDLDRDHLGRLAVLVRRYEPMLVSEHLAWSSDGSRYLNDLLPVPYTRSALNRVAEHVDHVQTALGRRILLENPSTYLAFAESEFDEADFLAEIVRRTGCGLLLDVNNVYVSAINRGRDPETCLAAFPMQWVGEIHLAGHSRRTDVEGVALLVDSHDAPVAEPVWNLYRQAVTRCGRMPTLIERDANIPAWDELYAEVLRAESLMAILQPLAERQDQFRDALLDPALPIPTGLYGSPGSAGAERFAVYRNNVAVGLIEALRSTFPVVNRLVGDEFFTAMARIYAFQSPPSSPVLLAYGGGFPDFIAQFEPAAVLPYLADLARLEWLWLETYHAADAEPLAIEALHGVPVDRLPGLRLSLHPSAAFARFTHPVLEIWLAHREEGEPAPLEIGEGPEQLLLVRPHTDIQVTAISPGALAFLDAIRVGSTIAEAVEAALEREPAIETSSLFRTGLFIGFAEA